MDYDRYCVFKSDSNLFEVFKLEICIGKSVAH